MPIQEADVDEVVSDEDFNEWLGGQGFGGAVELKPAAWDSLKPARQHALDRLLEALRRRVPPIEWGDMGYKSELRMPVMYGAAEHLYQLAMSTALDDSNFAFQRKLWAEKFEDSLSGLTPTLTGGLRGSAGGGFTVSRR